MRTGVIITIVTALTVGVAERTAADNLYRASGNAGVVNASGYWSDVDKWTIYDGNASPKWWLAGHNPTSNDSVRIYGGVSVTGDTEVVQYSSLYIGASNGSGVSKFYKKNGRIEVTTPASSNPTEIGASSGRTAESIMELEDVDFDCGAYRLVIGRNGGNAHYIQRGGSLLTPDLLIGISSTASAAPNTMYLENVCWTNILKNWNIGYSSCNTNIVHVKGGEFVTTKTIGLGNSAHADYTAGTSAPGEDFLVLENAKVAMNQLKMPNSSGHNTHFMLSNSVVSLTQVLSGNAPGTTNEVVIDSCDITLTSTQQLGYKQDNTVNRFAVRRQKAPHTSAKYIFDKLNINPDINPGVDVELEFTDSDFEDYSSYMYVVSARDRGAKSKWSFIDMAVPPVQLAVNSKTTCEGSVGELVLSNAVWDTSASPKSMVVASGVGTKGVFRSYNSRLVGNSFVVSDNSDGASHDSEGEVYISGGSATFSTIYVRRGVGRFVLDNGAAVTNTAKAYFPNMTGTRSTFELRNGAEFVVPAGVGAQSGFIVDNQPGTLPTILVNGGRLILKDADTIFFGTSASNIQIIVNSGLVDFGTKGVPFAKNSGAHGKLELNGGTWISAGFANPQAGSDQRVLFNGGVFKAPGNCTVSQAPSVTTVGNGGAIFDTAGAENVTISSALAHDEDANAVDGGLVKRGEGRLTLGVASTFTGPVVVEGGELALGVEGALPENCTVTLKVADGASLVRTGTVPYPAGLVIDAHTQPLDRDTSYALVDMAAGETAPTVLLPTGWQAVVRDGKLVAKCPKGTQLLFR